MTFTFTVTNIIDLLTCPPAFICLSMTRREQESDLVRYELPTGCLELLAVMVD